MKNVCFTGHRPPKINSENTAFVRSSLSAVTDELIGRGFTHFISGMALGVDMLAAETVLEKKKDNPEITLECAVPCRGQANRWSMAERERYSSILASADKVTTLNDRYTPWCMQMRNVYMVDSSDVVVAVFDGSAGGTANTVNYAKLKNREIIFIPLSEDNDG